MYLVRSSSGRQLAQAKALCDSGSNFLRVGAVKGFADGSTGSRTSWFHEDYTDQPGYFGTPRQRPCEMESMVRSADAAGLQIAFHAIGDRANTEMLEIYERVGGRLPRPAGFAWNTHSTCARKILQNSQNSA